MSSASGQLRVVTYNTATGSVGGQQTARPAVATVLEAIGNESVGGIAKPIDVLLLQEQFSMEVSAQSFVDVLNGIYGAGTYARSNLNAATSDFQGEGGGPGLVYNTQTVELVDEIRFGVVNGSNQARSTMRYQLRPVGYDSSADFYVYNNHYKASTGAANEDRRLVEATAVRNNADSLGAGVPIIYAGDFNVRSSGEASFQQLLSAGHGQAFDPIEASGTASAPVTWHNNSSLRFTHTQSPVNSALYPGQVTGGMDDRFDFQLVTAALLDNDGLSFLPGSYRAFGNNGTHNCCNSNINTGNGASPTVLSALMHASDHLPVVADYQVPAIMQVTLDSAPGRVLRGAEIAFNASMVNAANVVATTGADELEYTLSTTGALAGGGSGSVAALTGGDTIPLSFDTSVAGLAAGQVQANSSSKSAANASFMAPVSLDVLDHANPSFAADNDVDLLEIDFGQVPRGELAAPIPFQIFNLEQTIGFTSKLDLDAIDVSDDVPWLGTNLNTFAGLTAGQASTSFFAFLGTSVPGTFSETYTLTFSDEDLPGSIQHQLTLVLSGEVIAALPGDYNGDGRVDAADYSVWRDALGAMVPAGTGADGNSNGVVDEGDYGVWQEAFGTTSGVFAGSSHSVPEPTAIAMTVAVLAGFLGVRRRLRMDL